jgi:hypothetical protein
MALLLDKKMLLWVKLTSFEKKLSHFETIPKYKSDKNWEIYRKQRNLVTKIKRDSIKTYFYERIFILIDLSPISLATLMKNSLKNFETSCWSFTMLSFSSWRGRVGGLSQMKLTSFEKKLSHFETF